MAASPGTVGNVPIVVGFGTGANAPASFIVAGVILSLFALGYSAMARHIPATGAFYGFVSYGLGRVIGMGAGALTTMAYMVFEASVAGLFAFFAQTFFATRLGIDVSWVVFALIMLAINAAATYFKINLAAGILGATVMPHVVYLHSA